MNESLNVEYEWQEYRQQLLAFIRVRVANIDDAEDILSDVFIRLVATINTEKTPENITAWLYRVTHNRIIDYYRAAKVFEPLPELLSEAAESDAMRAIAHCLLPMVNTLPEKYRLPLLLSEIEGYQYLEVGRQLDLSLVAVKSRILRGRKKLLGRLLACCEFATDQKGRVIDFAVKSGDGCVECQSLE